MDIATKEEPLPVPIGPVAESIAARIASKGEQLTTEEANERDVIAQRKAILADADDATIDELENKIGASRSKQLRIIEQIDVLRVQLREANEIALSAELDALAARADQARIIGERAIAEYAKLAASIVPVLKKLSAAEQFVQQVNVRLHKAGRTTTIASPNLIRCRLPRQFDRTVRKRVGIGQAEHPHHNEYKSRSGNGEVAYLANGGSCPTFMEVDVVEHVRERGEYPTPIHEATHLPGIEIPEVNHCSLPLYDGEHAEVDEIALRELEAEIDGGTLGKLGKAASKLLGGSKK